MQSNVVPRQEHARPLSVSSAAVDQLRKSSGISSDDQFEKSPTAPFAGTSRIPSDPFVGQCPPGMSIGAAAVPPMPIPPRLKARGASFVAAQEDWRSKPASDDIVKESSDEDLPAGSPKSVASITVSLPADAANDDKEKELVVEDKSTVEKPTTEEKHTEEKPAAEEKATAEDKSSTEDESSIEQAPPVEEKRRSSLSLAKRRPDNPSKEQSTIVDKSDVEAKGSSSDEIKAKGGSSDEAKGKNEASIPSSSAASPEYPKKKEYNSATFPKSKKPNSKQKKNALHAAQQIFQQEAHQNAQQSGAESSRHPSIVVVADTDLSKGISPAEMVGTVRHKGKKKKNKGLNLSHLASENSLRASVAVSDPSPVPLVINTADILQNDNASDVSVSDASFWTAPSRQASAEVQQIDMSQDKASKQATPTKYKSQKKTDSTPEHAQTTTGSGMTLNPMATPFVSPTVIRRKPTPLHLMAAVPLMPLGRPKHKSASSNVSIASSRTMTPSTSPKKPAKPAQADTPTPAESQPVEMGTPSEAMDVEMTDAPDLPEIVAASPESISIAMDTPESSEIAAQESQNVEVTPAESQNVETESTEPQSIEIAVAETKDVEVAVTETQDLPSAEVSTPQEDSNKPTTTTQKAFGKDKETPIQTTTDAPKSTEDDAVPPTAKSEPEEQAPPASSTGTIKKKKSKKGKKKQQQKDAGAKDAGASGAGGAEVKN
ncbi:hypothetical protein B0T11DRAFT_99945 [Plectosphaerella cucumerina]|uniref:Uncharacterized protein n=1 Tax=Plectosphaerella cucumerina TaxID=40658 RepID=A0A8K0TA75_9PEZI|nr:hypothetical protein B0T11DRAFT_99945 [Plectosphaerella cucumerina]